MGGKIRTLSVLSLVLGLAAVGTLALAVATDYWLFTVEPVTENMFTTEGDGSVPMVSRTLMDFFLKFGNTLVIFVGPLIPLIWTSCDVCPGFLTQDGSPALACSVTSVNGRLRFTSDVTPADLLASIVACTCASM